MATHQNVDVANFTAATAIDNNFLMLAMNGMFAAGVAYSAYNVIDAYEKGGENGFNDAIKQLGIEVVPHAIGAASGYVIGKALGAVYPTAQAAAKAVIDANPSLKLALGAFADKLTVIGQVVSGSTVGKVVIKAGSKVAKKAAKIKNEAVLKIGLEAAGASFSKCVSPKDLLKTEAKVCKAVVQTKEAVLQQIESGCRKSMRAATLPASSRMNQLQLQRDLVAREVSGGHALEKHIVTQGEFPGWIRTRNQLHQHLKFVVEDPETLYRKAICTDHKKFECGKNVYYQEKTNTLIVNNQHAPDGGTTYQPKIGKQKFHETT